MISVVAVTNRWRIGPGSAGSDAYTGLLRK